MIFVYASLFICWGLCLYCAQIVPGWKWPTFGARRANAGISNPIMQVAYWIVWLGLYASSAVGTACAILRVLWILNYSDEDPILWVTLAVGIPVMMYFTYGSFQDLERERERGTVRDDDF